MVTLSADLGEGSPGEDELWPLLDAANVACGGHTGDEHSMRVAVGRARQFRVSLGAHPSYPDRPGFGRRPKEITDELLRQSIISQLQQLSTLATQSGLWLEHVKAHGALYNEAHKDDRLAELLVEAIWRVDPKLAIVCSTFSAMARAARLRGCAVIREAFADRRYQDDGSLMPRHLAGSTLSVEESSAQAGTLATKGMVITCSGARLSLPFDTLCIHADMPDAMARLRAIRQVVRPGSAP